VIDSTPTYLEVAWMPGCVTERVPIGEVDNLLRVAHAESLSATGDKTNVEVLKTLLALHRIQASIAARIANCNTDAEKESTNRLIQRSFDKEGCDWDKAHKDKLFQLAIEPSTVGLLFKLQERIHRLSCNRH